jgi:hypothetical protein
VACRTIYELIEAIRQRPAVFVKDKSLRELEIYLYGYVACVDAHGLVEKTGGRPFHPREFAIWLYDALGWSGCQGFAYAIEQHTRDADQAFERFFELVERYRNGTVEPPVDAGPAPGGATQP